MGHTHTARLFPEPFGPLAGHCTYAITQKLEADFDMVRLVYGNDAPTPYEVSAACIAASSAPGTEAGWKRVTFAGGESRLIVPAAEDEPVFACSDWMRLASIAPIEDDGLPWLMTRTFLRDGGRGIVIGP